MQNRFSTLTLLVIFITLFSTPFLIAQEKSKEATWIWYPGDFEVWLSNKMQVRRTEREAVFPPLWQYYSPYALVTFQKEVDTSEPDEVKIYSEGTFQLLLDGVHPLLLMVISHILFCIYLPFSFHTYYTCIQRILLRFPFH
jgi:hypothetical protein